MESIVAPGTRWPDRVLELCRRCAPRGAGPAATPDDRAAAWIALRDGLALFLRRHARNVFAAGACDLEDLASTKALDLFSRCESGQWEVAGRSGGELAAYLSTVARNAVVDLARRSTRFVFDPHPDGTQDVESDVDARPARPAGAIDGAADAPAMAHEFVQSLRACLDCLAPRERRVWFFRVFYEMSSREIAQHPAVALRVGHIDVMMRRTRDTIRDCMRSKGLEPADMPAGTFVALWESIEALKEEHPIATTGTAGR